MGKPADFPRPVVLSLAEIQKYPSRKYKYAMTLPFDPSEVFPRITADTIKQTRKRWIWFSQARRLDDTLGTRFGTLGYLPWELRQYIYRQLFEDCFEHPIPHELNSGQGSLPYLSRRDWEEEGFHPHHSDYQIRLSTRGDPDIFNLQSYDFWHADDAPSYLLLHLASPTLQVEFEQFLLSQYTFKFFCPKGLSQFLNQLSTSNRNHLRRVMLSLSSSCRCCIRSSSDQSWMDICPRLPPKLRLVTIDLNDRLFLPHMMNGILIRGPEGVAAVRYAAEIVEVLAKQIVRCSPGTKLAVIGDDYFAQEDHDVLDAALNDVER